MSGLAIALLLAAAPGADDAVRAEAYALLMRSGYTVNDRAPVCYCLAVLDPAMATGARDATPAESPEPRAGDPPLLPLARCRERGLVLFTGALEWSDATTAVVRAGLLKLQTRNQQVWRAEPDARRVTVQEQDGRFVAISGKLEDRPER